MHGASTVPSSTSPESTIRPVQHYFWTARVDERQGGRGQQPAKHIIIIIITIIIIVIVIVIVTSKTSTPSSSSSSSSTITFWCLSCRGGLWSCSQEPRDYKVVVKQCCVLHRHADQEPANTCRRTCSVPQKITCHIITTSTSNEYEREWSLSFVYACTLLFQVCL